MRQVALFAFALAFGGSGAAPKPAPPDWRDEILYQMVVDRFADSDASGDGGGDLSRWQGGDWKGIEEKLGYLQELGVTALWISPVVKNVDRPDAYHGYWAQDLSQHEARFGDRAELRSMVSAAHRRGMKVVLDVVTNHMGQLFFYDRNGDGKVDPDEYDPDFGSAAPIVFFAGAPAGVLGTARAYHGKGRILDYEDQTQRELGDFRGGLKDVATELPEVREEMASVFTRWVEEAGFDGLRVDSVKHVEHGFWQYFAPEVRRRVRKERFFIFGEAFDGRDEVLASYTRPGELDGVLYFSQAFTLRSVFGKERRSMKEIARRWAALEQYGDAPQEGGIGISPRKALVSFLDNHDVPRFLHEANGEVAALRNALTFLFAAGGVPCLYYGTEQDFAGGADPANREPLWKSGYRTDGETFRHVARLARIRKAYRALTRGDTRVVAASDDVLAFERSGGDAGDRYALAVVSTRAASITVHVSQPGTTLVDVLDPARFTYMADAQGNLSLTMPAQAAMILVPREQVVQGI